MSILKTNMKIVQSGREDGGLEDHLCSVGGHAVPKFSISTGNRADTWHQICSHLPRQTVLRVLQLQPASVWRQGRTRHRAPQKELESTLKLSLLQLHGRVLYISIGREMEQDSTVLSKNQLVNTGSVGSVDRTLTENAT